MIHKYLIIGLLALDIPAFLQAAEYGAASEGTSARHYTTVCNERDQIVQQMWPNGFHRPHHKHTIEEFIGGLVRSTREGGLDSAITFLKKAISWGFAVDSVSYNETEDGNAELNLRYFILLNKLSKTQQEQSEILPFGIMHSIVGGNDVRMYRYEVSVFPIDDRWGSFITNFALALAVPPSLRKRVSVDI